MTKIPIGKRLQAAPTNNHAPIKALQNAEGIYSIPIPWPLLRQLYQALSKQAANGRTRESKRQAERLMAGLLEHTGTGLVDNTIPPIRLVQPRPRLGHKHYDVTFPDGTQVTVEGLAKAAELLGITKGSLASRLSQQKGLYTRKDGDSFWSVRRTHANPREIEKLVRPE